MFWKSDCFNKYSFLHMQKSLQSTYACRGYKYSPSITDKKEGKEGFLWKRRTKKDGLLKKGKKKERRTSAWPVKFFAKWIIMGIAYC